MKPTALGVYLLVLPDSYERGTWQVAFFTKSGKWQSSTVGLASKAAAIARRRELVRYHKRLARQRARGKR